MRAIDLVPPAAAPAMTAQRMQCFKTKRCRFWLENRCSRGDKCTYAHTDVELRCPPDLTKTKICTRWKRGACDKTPSECAYAHGVEDLRGAEDNSSPSSGAPSTNTSTEHSATLMNPGGASESRSFGKYGGLVRSTTTECSCDADLTPSTSSATLLSSSESYPAVPASSNASPPFDPQYIQGCSTAATTTTVAPNTVSTSSSCSSPSSSSGIRTLIGNKVSTLRLDLTINTVLPSIAKRDAPHVPRLPLVEQATLEAAASKGKASWRAASNEFLLDFAGGKFADETAKDTVRSVASMASTTLPPLTPAGTNRSLESALDGSYASVCDYAPPPSRRLWLTDGGVSPQCENDGGVDQEEEADDNPPGLSYHPFDEPAQMVQIFSHPFPVRPYWPSSVYHEENWVIMPFEKLHLVAALTSPYYD